MSVLEALQSCVTLYVRVSLEPNNAGKATVLCLPSTVFSFYYPVVFLRINRPDAIMCYPIAYYWFVLCSKNLGPAVKTTLTNKT